MTTSSSWFFLVVEYTERAVACLITPDYLLSSLTKLVLPAIVLYALCMLKVDAALVIVPSIFGTAVGTLITASRLD